MKAWSRRRGRLVAEFEPAEAALLRGLVGQVRDMLAARVAESPPDELAQLTGMTTGPSTPPEDRVLARLLPDFSRDDGDLSGGMRSLHEPDLIAAKDGAAATVLETCPLQGGQIRLDAEQAAAWLAALNDVRLALGTALEITEEMPDELPPDDPRAEHLPVYHWLTWMQESLIQAVSG